MLCKCELSVRSRRYHVTCIAECPDEASKGRKTPGTTQNKEGQHRLSQVHLSAHHLPLSPSLPRPAHRRGSGPSGPRSEAASQCHMTQDTDTSLMGTDPRTSVTPTTRGLPCSVGGQAGTFQGGGSTVSCSDPPLVFPQ